MRFVVDLLTQLILILCSLIEFKKLSLLGGRWLLTGGQDRLPNHFSPFRSTGRLQSLPQEPGSLGYKSGRIELCSWLVSPIISLLRLLYVRFLRLFSAFLNLPSLYVCTARALSAADIHWFFNENFRVRDSRPAVPQLSAWRTSQSGHN